MRSLFFLLLFALVPTYPAVAQVVEVAPGVHVTKKAYPAPRSEQPFYGFIPKPPSLIAVDEEFVAAMVRDAGSRQQAVDHAIKRGWSAFHSGDLVVAARRFNQAYLIAPEQSGVYHGFAALTQARFNDMVYADELYRIALKQPEPSQMLRADYGRFLLIAKRPADARPLLEQAVVDAPEFDSAWLNLAWSRLQTGDRPGACAAAAKAEKFANHKNVSFDIPLLKREAKC